MTTFTTSTTISNQHDEDMKTDCSNPTNHQANSSDQPLSKSGPPSFPSPTWKLYENPSYNIYTTDPPPFSRHRPYSSSSSSSSYFHHHRPYILHPKYIAAKSLTHHCSNLLNNHLPLYTNTRPVFTLPQMESDIIDDLRAQIKELKAELHIERKLRKKIESLNKKLVKELAEEREEIERGCEELMRQLEYKRTEEIEKMKKELDVERKMLKVAEVFREERVQMKLADAKMLYEKKLLELGGENTAAGFDNGGTKRKPSGIEEEDENVANSPNIHRLISRSNSTDKAASAGKSSGNSGGGYLSAPTTAELQRSSSSILSEKFNCSTPICAPRKSQVQSPEPENPHIKRGIKGYVEFPKVLKVINGSTTTISSSNSSSNINGGYSNKSSNGRNYSSYSNNSITTTTKLQCQKAQLRILLKQRSPLRSSSSSNLIIS